MGIEITSHEKRKIYRNFTVVQSIVNFVQHSFASFWQAANENPCSTAEVSNELAFAIMKWFLSNNGCQKSRKRNSR